MNPRAEFIKESYSESPTFRTRTDFGQRFDAFQRKHPEFFSNDPREISKYGLYELWRTQRTQTLPQREEVNTIFARRLEFEVVQRQEYDRWRDKRKWGPRIIILPKREKEEGCTAQQAESVETKNLRATPSVGVASVPCPLHFQKKTWVSKAEVVYPGSSVLHVHRVLQKHKQPNHIACVIFTG